MKIWGSPGVRAIVFATLILTTVFTAPLAHATGNAACSVENAGSIVPADSDDSLYRVRVGDVERGEIAGRFYVERNIAGAESELGIIGDYDPDNDGWALVGHTLANNDCKELLYFLIDPTTHVPYLVLGVVDTDTQIILTPVSLAIVLKDKDRLLKSAQSGFDPTVIVVPGSDNEPPQTDVDDDGIIFLEDEINVGQPQVQSVVMTPQPVNTDTIQHVDALSAMGETIKIVPVDHIKGISTMKSPSYFDGSTSKNTADIANTVGNTFLIGGSILVAVLLGIVLLIRSMTLLGK